MRNLLCAAAAITAVAVVAPAAKADAILTFGQIGNNPLITATANGAGTQTTITALNAPVNVTQILGGVPSTGFLDLDIHSTDAFTALGGGGFQHYAGSFSITSLTGNTGTNFLSGTFSDVVVGVGSAGTLQAGAPPDTIDLTSDVITELSPPSGIALSFAGISPAFSVDGTTIGSFTSSVSGTFSASPVPEPASLAIFGTALLGLGAIRRRRRGNQS